LNSPSKCRNAPPRLPVGHAIFTPLKTANLIVGENRFSNTNCCLFIDLFATPSSDGPRSRIVVFPSRTLPPLGVPALNCPSVVFPLRYAPEHLPICLDPPACLPYPARTGTVVRTCIVIFGASASSSSSTSSRGTFHSVLPSIDALNIVRKYLLPPWPSSGSPALSVKRDLQRDAETRTPVTFSLGTFPQFWTLFLSAFSQHSINSRIKVLASPNPSSNPFRFPLFFAAPPFVLARTCFCQRRSSPLLQYWPDSQPIRLCFIFFMSFGSPPKVCQVTEEVIEIMMRYIGSFFFSPSMVPSPLSESRQRGAHSRSLAGVLFFSPARILSCPDHALKSPASSRPTASFHRVFAEPAAQSYPSSGVFMNQ